MPLSQKQPGRTPPGGLRLFLFTITVAAVSLACATPRQAAAGDSAATATTTPRPAASAPRPTPAPESKKAAGPAAPPLTDVRQAVARACQDAVTVDETRGEPFIIGDFNGDGSEDLAVVVRPAKGALPKINSEYANWIVEDPQRAAAPEASLRQSPGAPEPVRVQEDDLLLLILHGYRRAGWHDPLARQTFLLRGAVGESMRAQSPGEAARAEGGKAARSGVAGEVIREKLKGQEGFLYWAGAKYVWHQ